MRYNQPFDKSDPTAPYVDGNPSAGVEGSIPRAAAIEYPQREIVQAIVDSGQTPDNGDLTQLSKAIRSMGGTSHIGDDTSASVNTVIATVAPAITNYVKGHQYNIKIANTPTGAAQANFNGVGLRTISRQDGSAVQAGDILAGQEAVFIDTGSKLQLMGLGRSEVARIIANPTIYIRKDGNDANDGSANDPAHAFLTIDNAVSYISSRYAGTGQSITYTLGNAGTYPIVNPIRGPAVILGDPANQANYIISGVGAVAGTAVVLVNSSVTFNGVTINNTGTVCHTLGALPGGTATLINTTLNSTGGANSIGHLYAGPGGNITIFGGVILQANAAMGYAWIAAGGTINQSASVLMTLSGTQNYTACFALCYQLGLIGILPNASISGTATGVKYSVSLNGVINTGSAINAGPNYFPGNSAGAVATGGIYV